MATNVANTTITSNMRRAVSLGRKLARWLLSCARIGTVRILNWPVKIPFTVDVREGVKLVVTDEGQLNVGKVVSIGAYSQIRVRTGKCTIGHNTELGQGTIIVCQERITIGKAVLIAEYVTIRDQDHNFEEGAAKSGSGFSTAPILIGDNVWLGAKVTVTKGVSIGENSVIGANSVVTDDIPDNVVAVGAPAKVVRKIGRNPPVPPPEF